MHPIHTVHSKIVYSPLSLRHRVKALGWSVMMAGTVATCSMVSLSVKAEPLLMAFDEYMQRCMQTYGGDEVTEKVCESQYRAIEEKEAALTAQTDALTDAVWSGDEGRPNGGAASGQ
ncbi:hypothetical protein JCM19237_6070 [Photobacterium aphoticum]|uniref:Uncharacterized protein n=1 Tax=Photobacterium aphoticum TaxID=754436 RepID=A0A090R6A3_9GAMM|nr:hypothetical protein JCM19237_6070 [Photobacterium aphoticum]